MSRIEATGSYLPKTIVSNDHFEESDTLFGSINEFFTGFDERRHATKEETGIEMASLAAQDALHNSQYCAEDIDLIVGIIQPSEYLYGDDLNLIQHNIGAWNASVLPINTGCSSFLAALNLADSLISSGRNKRVLVVVAANWVNNMLDQAEKGFAFAGDGAGAIILDGDASSMIDIEQINRTTPPVFESMVMKSPVFTGKKEYFKVSEPEGISTVKDLILFPISVAKNLLERNESVEVDRFISHQAGVKMMQTWANKLKIPTDRICHTVDKYANMISANIPVSLNYWVREGRIVRGDTILFFAPSAGGNYIAILWKY